MTDKHPRVGSFGFGDSEGDIEMLLAVEHAICIAPSVGLVKIAHEKGWTIIDSAEQLNSREVPSAVNSALVA